MTIAGMAEIRKCFQCPFLLAETLTEVDGRKQVLIILFNPHFRARARDRKDQKFDLMEFFNFGCGFDNNVSWRQFKWRQ